MRLPLNLRNLPTSLRRVAHRAVHLAVFPRLKDVTWVIVALMLMCCGAVTQAFESPNILRSAQHLGPGALIRVQALLETIQEVTNQDDDARIKAINGFFNRRVVYKEDKEAWNAVDYWASPLETLAKGEGDCEDYAIAKYFSLLAAGVPSVKMRMVYVRAQMAGGLQAHMVLAYYPQPNAEPLILDNLVTDIRPASRRPDLTPVFSFNAEGLWQGVAGSSAGDPSARLSRWREVLAKAKAEGWW